MGNYELQGREAELPEYAFPSWSLGTRLQIFSERGKSSSRHGRYSGQPHFHRHPTKGRHIGVERAPNRAA